MKGFRSISLWIGGFVFLSSLLAQAQQATGDLVLYNGKIATVDDHSFSSQLGTIAQAIHVQNGKILHIGSNAQIRAFAGPNTKVIDLKGRTVIPGVILTHEHPWDWGSVNPYTLKKNLADDKVVFRVLDSSPPEQAKQFPAVLKEAVSKARPGQWIHILLTSGKNFEWAAMSNGGMSRQLIDPLVQVPREMLITKEQIDVLAPNNPVFSSGWRIVNIFAPVGEGNRQSGGVNQKAIDESIKVFPDPHMNPYAPGSDKLLSSTPAASPSRWMVHDVMLKDYYPQSVEIQRSELEWWAGYGMTAFASNAYSPSNRRVYAELDRKGEMPIRNMWTWNWNPEYLYEDPFFVIDLAARIGEGSDYLWHGGAIITTGANCTTASPLDTSKAFQYRQSQARAQGQALQVNPSCNYAPGSRNAEYISKYIRAGGRFVNLHTTGDMDIDNMMVLIEKVSKEMGMTDEQIRAKRHGMDHGVMWPRPEQIPVMKRLGILASGASSEIVMASPTVFDLYGERAAGWVVPKKSLVQAGVYNSLEIDVPIATADNVTLFSFGIAPLITRKSWDGKVYAQNERVDRETALKIATYYGSYYLLRENLLGSLEPGKFADFLVLDRDYLTIPESDIEKIRVLMTVVGGKVVHMVPSLARELGMQPVGAQVRYGAPAAQW